MEVTTGLAESNGSLLPGLWRDWIHVTCGLTVVQYNTIQYKTCKAPCCRGFRGGCLHRDQLQAQRSVTSMGKLLPYLTATRVTTITVVVVVVMCPTARRRCRCSTSASTPSSQVKHRTVVTVFTTSVYTVWCMFSGHERDSSQHCKQLSCVVIYSVSRKKDL